MYAGARMLRILSNTDKRMSELSYGLAKYESTPEVIVKVTEDTKLRIVEDVKNDLLSDGYKVIDIDGASALIGTGWGLVRASNTGPNLTIKAEAKTLAEANEILEKIKELVEKHR